MAAREVGTGVEWRMESRDGRDCVGEPYGLNEGRTGACARSSQRTASTWQVAANRRCARHSTGPRSPAGKAVVAANAVTHGLSSRDPKYLPAAMAEALPGRMAMWRPSVGGVTESEHWLLRKLAMASLRADVAEAAIGAGDAEQAGEAEEVAIDLEPEAERLRF